MMSDYDTAADTSAGAVTARSPTPAHPKLVPAAAGGARQGTTVSLEYPEPNLLIAFLGDQGDTSNSDQVLELIKSEGAAAIVHGGDFDYMDSPPIWNGRIDRILGPSFPYFAVVGNHDVAAWDGVKGYAEFIAARQARVAEMQCTGDPGVKATCRFHGLLLVESCIGTSELENHGDCGLDSVEQTNFIRGALASSAHAWKICSWHKNQHDLQVGTKTDEVGWEAYRACQASGAIIHTAHEHSYARTYALSDLGDPATGFGKVGLPDWLALRPGQSFVFVSGLGGRSIREYDPSHDSDSWWASYYTANQWLKNGTLQSGTATFGATFIRFNVMGNRRRAWGYFKDVTGKVADEFTLDLSE